MTVFQPWNLLWLLLLVPVIVFFYLLKLKRREVVVSSVLLWDRLVKDVQANAPFQKLRKNLLLLLQLLVACLAVGALARPALLTWSPGGSQVVVVLDGSASMQSRDERGSRFEAARAAALKMVSGMRGGDRMMVLLAGSRTHRLTGFTRDRSALRAAISRAEPGDTTTNLRDAVLLAASLAGSGVQHQGSRIYTLSDGAFPDLEELDTRGSDLQFVRVGSRSDNMAIVAMDLRRAFTEAGSYQLFLAVRNYSREPRKTNVELYRNDALVDVRPLALPGASPETGYAEKAEVINDLGAATGILRARLDIRDDLEADNEAYTQLSPRSEVNVLLVTAGNLYLEKALNLDSHVRLSTTTPAAYRGQGGYDVVVFENEAPREAGPGSHLYINCGGATAPVEIQGKIANASILDWDRVHPVMRYVKLSQLQMPESLKAQKRPWGVTLAEHEGGTAIAVGERGGVKSAYVGFPLLKTEFPLRVAFPIFFNNLVQWLAARPGRTEGLQLRTGETATLDLPEGVEQVTVTAPDGRRQTVRAEGRRLNWADTERRGIYRVEGKGFRQEFAVNLLSRDESATQPRNKVQFGKRPVLAGTGRVRTALEFWRYLLLLAVLLLAVEWWVYHRRI